MIRRPSDGFEGYVQTQFGNYSDKRNEFTLNLPVVSDKLLVRVSGLMQQRDGYTYDLQNGKDLDNQNYYAWRIGVTLKPSDDFENYLLYYGTNISDHSASFILANVNAGMNFGSIPLGRGSSRP